MNHSEALFESRIDNLPLVQRGKVRDVYAVDNEHLLIVASDRISAFDVILPTPIPGKGEVLTQISNFWFGKLDHIVPNHLSDRPLETVLDKSDFIPLRNRSAVVRRIRALPVEAIVRGYLIGSAWKDYRREGAICGIGLPQGLEMAEQLPEPIFTPSTKAEVGGHDINIDFEQAIELTGRGIAAQIREISLALYREAAEHARSRGIIIADTKFEFGLDGNGALVLIDEALTPDSSRLWPVDQYRTGSSPPSFDKQYVRDYLETLDWNKAAPGPALPEEVVANTARKYHEARDRLIG